MHYDDTDIRLLLDAIEHNSDPDLLPPLPGAQTLDQLRSDAVALEQWWRHMNRQWFLTENFHRRARNEELSRLLMNSLVDCVSRFDLPPGAIPVGDKLDAIFAATEELA